MQKVEGSNPFSRFFANALHMGALVPARVTETKWNHPRISERMRADSPQFFADSALHLAPQAR